MATITYYEQSNSKNGTTGHMLAFCMFWSIMASITLLVDALLWNRILDDRQVILISFAAIAAIITAAIAWYLEPLVTRNKPTTARFASIFILLAVGTIGATFLCSALYTLPFFIDNMNPFLSLAGLEDLYFFFLSHGYSFAVSTVRLFLPLGLISLILASIFYCILCQSPDQKY